MKLIAFRKWYAISSADDRYPCSSCILYISNVGSRNLAISFVSGPSLFAPSSSLKTSGTSLDRRDHTSIPPSFIPPPADFFDTACSVLACRLPALSPMPLDFEAAIGYLSSLSIYVLPNVHFLSYGIHDTGSYIVTSDGVSGLA